MALSNQTNQTLLEQLQITEFEVDYRKALFSIGDADVTLLADARPVIERHIEALVNRFYELQTAIPEIALLIGDADTLARLRSAQRRYILDLFGGFYDLEYVNNRLRIGLVHKRIGVEPKLYLTAVHTLKGLLSGILREGILDKGRAAATLAALEKLLLFDVTLVFDTYIRSMVAEIEISRGKSEQYARLLEEKVRQRTQELEQMSRVDPLTDLLSVRDLEKTLARCLRSAQRRSEPVSIAYIDINDFKQINDTKGHQRGDDVLREVGAAIKAVSRAEDSCFRYGGDEFCLVLPNCREEQAREIYLTRLNAEVRRRLGEVTLSAGIVQTGPDRYLDPEELIRSADERMYAAKRSSKTRRLKSA